MRGCARVISVGATCVLALWLLAAPAGAWNFTASASTTCASTQAEITVTFKNTESKNGITVTVTDNQTGHSISLGSVKAGKTATGTILTGQTSLKAGTVTFHMTWSNGQSGHMDSSRSYKAIDCAEPPPMLAEGLNGFTVGGAIVVVGAGVLYWRRRRAAHPAPSLS
jgi:hypothetical protein